jgi:hypothetical protein
LARNCVRCDVETNNDFGNDTRIYVQSLASGERKQATHLCDSCLEWLDSRIERLLVRKPVELTPKEKELKEYFD